MNVRVEKLTAEAFAPFGFVVSRQGIAESADDFTWYGEMGTMRNAETQLNLCSMKVHAPDLKEVEIHNETREALIVLRGKGVVLAVAPKGEFDVSKLRAFYVEQGDGVIFEKGTYHSTPFSVGETAEMLIVFQKDTGAHDLILTTVGEGVRIDIDNI